jgi:class 3 adenylate cyclase/CHAT domain-containing protein/tetratricopeptide (TPR) repeat protein
MDEEKNNEKGPRPENIEQVLRERERLDQILQTRFRRKMAILFSDVCGYTQYMDRRGDISGRAWIQKHHDIVLPLIEKHEGKVLDIMGDGVMASFHNTLSAVKASVAIQKSLQEYNTKAEPSEEIHVSMGINTGEILIDDQDIAGDVVNVASRIESKADRDQILISRSAYEEVRGSEDILCRDHGTVSVKGKSQPLELFRVVWQDREVVLSEEPRLRTDEEVVEKRVKPRLDVFQLELTREKNRLKISAYEQRAGELSTVRHYEEIPFSIEKVGTRCHEIVETLNNANRKGRLTRQVLIKLREIGQVFRDELFTAGVKEKVRETGADHLILNLDEKLVHIPWELLHDGQQFLCERFNMGRLVKTRQTFLAGRSRLLGRPLKMLVLADPKGDLKGAYDEGIQIRDFMDRDMDFVNVSLRSDNVSPDFVREKIRYFDLVHFAGHADYDPKNPGESSWQLSNGIIKADELIKMAGTATMPALIFSNACQSARTEEWSISENFQDEIFGLANAFILAGVKHYVGTFWEILDEPSSAFALEFYRHLLSDMTVGQAVREARRALINEYGEETIVWASYLLYGDPTFNYMDQIQEAKPEKEVTKAPERETAAEVRAREEAVVFGEKEAQKTSKWWWGAVAAAIIVAFILWGYPGFLRTGTSEYEQSAIAFYKAGNYSEATNTCETLIQKNPKLSLSYLILGNISFMQGGLKKAEAHFKKALEAGQGTDEQKAEALMGLGRIASIGKDTERALEYYRQAAKLAPGSGQAYISQAVLLDNQGNYDQALALYDQARKLSPDDRSLKAMADQTREKASYIKNREKRERIDKLVQNLLKDFEKSVQPVPSDGWTSLPLTLWLMDFETQGNSLLEGKEHLISSGIIDQLIEKSRARVVERSVLDKLLEELKLSTTKLVDRSAALRLGKILAARLILSGRIIHSGPETQIAIRAIETETGQVRAAINESFGSAVPASTMAAKLSGILTEKLKSLYPLRGKISEIKGDEIILNIGKKQGTQIGQQFKIVQTDLILELISVLHDTSTAKVFKGDKENIQQGLRVEAL